MACVAVRHRVIYDSVAVLSLSERASIELSYLMRRRVMLSERYKTVMKSFFYDRTRRREKEILDDKATRSTRRIPLSGM